MTDRQPDRHSGPPTANGRHRRARRRTYAIVLSAVLVIVGGLFCAYQLQSTASAIQSHLTATKDLVPVLKDTVSGGDTEATTKTVAEIRSHTAAAKTSAENPLWVLAGSVPFLGENFRAVTELAQSGDDIANLALVPLAEAYTSLNWDALLPSEGGISLGALESAAPDVTSSAYALQSSLVRLQAIDKGQLMPAVAKPLEEVVQQLQQAKQTLNTAADAARVAPKLLGAGGSRNYLLLIQNNAESRASGGIAGALAVVTIQDGKVSLTAQSSAEDLGVMSPVLPVDEEQQRIYTSRLGKYMQDVNLTPDFPTAALTAQAMWQKRTGQRVDGVVSIDPVMMSYTLQATGPVRLNDPGTEQARAAGLPAELSGDNLVQTLLSDVYAKIKQPKLQDAYFSEVAREVFTAFTNGRGNGKGVLSSIIKGAEEGRVLLWSGDSNEQSVIAKYPFSGSIASPSISPAQFGAYFNDGTGAKMDYYLKNTVQILKQCPADGYEKVTIKITSTNSAPADAATSLPAYVTGAGNFGTPPGSILTNVVVYGPVQANVESVWLDGQKSAFAPYVHANRPVGVISETLKPGETKTAEFHFGKIIQHNEPNLVVTPTVQQVNDVVLPTENASCEQVQ